VLYRCRQFALAHWLAASASGVRHLFHLGALPLQLLARHWYANFRGGLAPAEGQGAIRRFAQDYRSAKPIRLEQNYRSTGAILAAANAAISRDRDTIPKRLWTEQKAGLKPTVRSATTAEDEARLIAVTIESLRAERTGDAPWSEFAVLVRAAFVMKPIVEALRNAAIPVRRVSDRAPEVATEVQAAIAWLRLAASRRVEGARERLDPGADDAFRRACVLPRRGISGSQFGRLRDAASQRDSRLPMLFERPICRQRTKAHLNPYLRSLRANDHETSTPRKFTLECDR